MGLSISPPAGKPVRVEESLYKELCDDVLARRIQPEDKYEIAAILESMGWNDSMAAESFGVDDVFKLAENIWNDFKSDIAISPIASLKRMGTLQYLILIIRSFLRGTIFALPMAVSVFAMLTLRFSLWSYQNLTLENATSIAIGTILSFMAVGGFTQAIARRGFMYIGQGHYNMARRITYSFLRLGFAVCILIILAYWAFCTVFAIFPWSMTFITVLYYLFLCAIWLSVTVMYMLQKEMVFTGLLIGGIIFVFILFRLVGLNIIVSQVISLIIVAVTGLIVAHYFFMKAERSVEGGIQPAMPRSSIVVYTSLPYFGYGFAYFTFLFVDRLMAWSTNDPYMPYLIWFRGDYELGLDFALLAIILPMGLVEVVINELMANLEADQKYFLATETRKFSRMYKVLYVKRFITVTVFAMLNAAVLYYVVKQVSMSGVLDMNFFVEGSITHFVFVWAVLSYCFVVMALLNALVCFSLGQPEMVFNSLIKALFINILLGFLLSRWFGHTFAVYGLLIGSLVFLILSARDVFKVLNKLDYYLNVIQ